MKRRLLGQHYLADQSVAQRMVDLAQIGRGDRVIEIGTGKGAITSMLIEKAPKLEAFEIDPQNYAETAKLVSSIRFNLHQEDAFRQHRDFDVLVSSLPYSESSNFIEWLAQSSYKRAVVIIQEDFFQKISAKPGSRIYRGISVIAQLSSTIVPKAIVGRNAFSPPPSVNSRIVLFKGSAKLARKEVLGIKKLFSLRRKTLAAVAREMSVDSASIGGLDKGVRLYTLTPGQVHGLVRRWLRQPKVVV
jgi:16S rRNA (adenine1518-N6/adenine1519-N6)-dimethyltransferase